MKRNIIKFVFLCTAIFCFMLDAQAAAQTYKLDSDHSYVLWHISHFGFSNPSGKWLADGTLVLDEAKPQNSTVNVTIHTADVSTGIKELDKHLKGPLFFDVTKYPTATFISDKVTTTGNHTAKVHGILTVRGISKPVTLDVVLNKLGVNPITDKKTAGFSAHTTLNRSDFGINTLLPGLGDEVKIDIESEANLTS